VRPAGSRRELLDRYARGHEEAHKRGEEGFGLNITYRAPHATGPLVTGDRAPDAPVLDANGECVRLFDLFRGPHSTRLVFGAPAPGEEHAYAVLRPGDRAAHRGRHVIDADGHAFAAYAASAGSTY
jgi:hypothetical protein